MRRAISLLLSILMVISLCPVSAFADDGTETRTETDGVEETTQQVVQPAATDNAEEVSDADPNASAVSDADPDAYGESDAVPDASGESDVVAEPTTVVIRVPSPDEASAEATDGAEDSETTEGAEQTEGVEDGEEATDGAEDSETIEGAEQTEGAEDGEEATEGTEDSENIEGAGQTEGVEDGEEATEGAEDSETIEGAEQNEGVEDGEEATEGAEDSEHTDEEDEEESELGKHEAAFSQEYTGAYLSAVANGKYKDTHDVPSVSRVQVSAGEGLVVLDAVSVQGLDNHTEITLTAMLQRLPELQDGESLAFYALNGTILANAPRKTDLSVGDQVTLALDWKSVTGVALVLVPAAETAEGNETGDDAEPIEGNDPAESAEQTAEPVDAGSGVTLSGLPVGAAAMAVPVRAGVPEGATSLGAYNITITNGEEELHHFDAPVTVTITNGDFANYSNIHVYHSGADGLQEVSSVSHNGATISFPASDFSIYIVTDEGSDARLTVKFHKADDTVATMMINQRQLGMIEKYIYDPGVGTLPEGTIFKGWTTNANYTAADANSGKTIAGVREDVTAKLNQAGGIQDGYTLEYYAMVFKPYNVTYLDELGIMVKVDQIYVLTSQTTNPTYSVTENYPTGEVGVDAQFMGWQQLVPEVSGEMVLHNIGDAPFELTQQNYTLKAYTQKGHWLIFDENLSNASYTEPQFIPIGGRTDPPANAPTRSGYTFDGWYTEDADPDARDGQVAGQLFTFDTDITANTRVYGKWTEANTASYSVVFWLQKVAGEGYDYSGTTLTVNNATVGSNTYQITVQNNNNATTRYARVYTGTGTNNYTNYNNNFPGFHLSTSAGTSGQGYDSPKPVEPEGTTVINVYYDRNMITYNFRYSKNNTQTFTGRFGAPFTQWPDPGDGLAWRIGSGQTAVMFPLPLVIFDPRAAGEGYDSFDQEVTFNRGDYSQHATLYVYKQTETGEWSYTNEYLIATAPLSGGNWTPSETYAGYTISGYRLNNTNGQWTDCTNSTSIPYTENVGSYWNPSYVYHDLYIRYTRNQYNITYSDGAFVDGSGNPVAGAPAARTNFATRNNVYFEADISGDTYNFTPALDGYTFLGWYDNALCVGDPYDFDTMPANALGLFAKWGHNEYEVNLIPGDTTEDRIVYANGNSGSYTGSSNTFYIDEGDVIGDVGGTRIYYELAGWYTDANYTQAFSFDAFVANRTMVAKFGHLYTADEIDPAYPTTIGEVNLYAKWRSKLIGAKGINVIYDVGASSDERTDTNSYVDGAEAIAAPATTPTDTNYVFSHWVVQHWTGSGYTDGEIVFPSGTFEVKVDDAKITDNETGTVVPAANLDPDGTYTYTVLLKAVYVEKDKEIKTHIYWYNNNGTEAFQKDENLAINEAVSIPNPTIYPRTGYEFLGWHRIVISVNGSSDNVTMEQALAWEQDEANWTQSISSAEITFDATTGEYSYNGKKATEVAADENHPYHAMFAVWKENEVVIHYAVASDSTNMGSVSKESETVNADTGTPQGSVASPASSMYAFDYWTCDNGTDPISTYATFVPSKGSSGIYEEHTYYAHFKLNKATVTVHHYLKGTTTPVAEDTTSSEVIESSYIAQPATTFLSGFSGYTLTADSYNPNQTVTVVAAGNTITIYYTLPLTIAAKTDSKTYDGNPLNGAYTKTSEGALEADAAGIEAKLPEPASITLVGSVTYPSDVNALKASILQNYPYYDITVTTGTLTITEPTDPSLVVTKNDGKADDYKYKEGETVTFTITVKNIYAEAQTITLTEIEGVTLAQSTFENVAPGATVTTTATYVIKPADMAAGSFKNTVTATLEGGKSYTAEDTVHTVAVAASIAVTKTADKTSGVKVGDKVTYTVVVTNSGNVTVSGIALEDALMAAADAPEAFDLAPEGTKTITYTYTVTQADVDAGKIENTAKATGKDPKGTDVTDSDDAEVTTVTAAAALTVEKTASPESGVKVGDKVTYTVVVTNSGNVSVKDGNLADDHADLSDKTFDLAPNEEATFTYTYEVTQADVDAGSIVNVVKANATAVRGENPAEASASATVTAEQKGHITITKETTSTAAAEDGKYVLGEMITYKITVTNDGNLTITNITVRDILTGNVWTIASMAPGEDKVYTDSHVVNDTDVEALKVVNEATVKGTSPDPKNPTVEDSDTVTDPVGLLKGMTVDSESVSVKYDGKAHTVTATSNIDDAIIEYSTDGGSSWSTTAPELTDVGNTTFSVRATKVRYETAQMDGFYLKVTPREIILTSATGSKWYDGTPLRIATVTVSGDGFVDGEGATYNVTGSRTEVGTSNNGFTYKLNENTKEKNYKITTVIGKLTILAELEKNAPQAGYLGGQFGECFE